MERHSQFALLKQQRFRPFFLTQFLGAFNDNVFKNALVTLITFHAGRAMGMSPSTLVNLCAGLFILPFFLFSATGGQLADKLEKARLIRHIKLAEIVIMALAAAGFFLGNLPLLLGVLFLMGAQSSFFGPVKYGILPQHLEEWELVGGNALVESGTFLAILLGTIAGGLVIAWTGGTPGVVSGAVILVAVFGWWASCGIPKAAPVAPGLRVNWNFLTETWRIIRLTRQERSVFLSVLGISWFWFYGALVLAQLPNYTKNVLGGNEEVMTLLLAVFSVGIGIGSLLCERLAAKRIEIGLVPLGSLGLTLFGADLAFAHPGIVNVQLADAAGFLADPGNWRVLLDLWLLALFGGFYIVPLYALIQSRSEAHHRSRVIAGNNVLNALFMVVAALVAVALLRAGLTIPQLFLVTALMNVAVAVFIYTLVPEFIVRLLVWMLVHTVYWVHERNLERIPDEGPAVLVCNHVSFVDALIIAAACRRPVRFVMYHRLYALPVLSFVFRTGGAISIAPAKEDPALLERAFDAVAAALAAGELVCMFPEGRLTGDGEMGGFRAGIERIVERTPVPVVPLALRGLWGSFFSRHGGRAFWGLPRKLWAHITLVAGEPVPPAEVSAALLQARVAALRGAEK